MSKLGLDPNLITRARQAADTIATDMDAFIRQRTTVALERTVLRLFGIDGADEEEIPYPNRVVEELQRHDLLGEGVTRTLARGILHTNRSAQTVAEAISSGELDIASLPEFSPEEIIEVSDELVASAIGRVDAQVAERARRLENSEPRKAPLHYVIVATGNIYEDVVQAKTAARQGADIIAVIRSTGQSLLDFVPYGATTEGYGGTYATQENFKIMRAGLDEVGEELGRYIRLCNYCSGLCMPEIAAMGGARATRCHAQ